MRSKTFIPALLAGTAAMTIASPARSQTAPSEQTQPAEAPATAIDAQDQSDIIVTAQKRSERLQDVPLAVTAISGDALAARQINNTSSLTQAVPSLTIQPAANPVASSFRIRGIGTSLFGLGTESSVSMVVDGVVSARQAQNFTDFADIERVEVLRGPQGTLFGKNATAGVINVVTARPSSTFEARGSFTAAEMGEYRVSGTVSGPLTDTLAARVTGYYNDVGGNLDNVLTGQDANGSKSWGVRGKLEWRPTSALTLLLSADYRKSNADCCQNVLVQANNPLRVLVSGPVEIAPDTRQVWNNDQTFANIQQQTYSLQADLDLGGVTLTSITAYQKYHLTQNAEVDQFGYTQPIYISPTSSAQFDLNYGDTHLRNFTQEVRVASAGSGPFTYVAGVFYSNLQIGRYFSRRRALCATGTVGQPCAAPTYQSLASNADLSDDNVAGFGQAELKLIGGLKAIGGVRVQYETVSVAGLNIGVLQPGDGLFGGAPTVLAKRSAGDTAVTGKAGLQYEFSRHAQVYATYTRGYKGLGFGTDLGTDFANQNPVLPEYVNAYEIGFKGQTSDGTFSLSAAAFLADYTNLQVQANRSNPLTGVVSYVYTNAGSSRTKGFELEATFRPSREFTVNAAVTYAKNSFDIDGLNCPQQFQAAAPVIALGGTRPINSCYRYQYLNAGGTLLTSGPVQDIRGGILPASPTWRINVSPRYETEVARNLAAFVQVDLGYQSDQQFALEQNPLLRQDGYALVDLSLGVRQLGHGFTATLFVKNLFDQNFYAAMSSSALLPTNLTSLDIYALRTKNADRYIGGTIGFSF